LTLDVAAATAIKVRNLPGVVSARYANATGELLVELSLHVTRAEEQRVVLKIARAANHPGTR
jgi:hypothetical protein